VAVRYSSRLKDELPVDRVRVLIERVCLTRHRLALLSSIALALVLADPVAAQAQRPARAVRIPGTDVVLEDGWLFRSTKDRCSYTVPGSWRVSADGRWASPPDGAASVGVFAITIASWSTHRATLKAAVRGATVRADTPRRFWIEWIDGPQTRQHISINDGTRVCTADIEATSKTVLPGVVQKIASSLSIAGNDALFLAR